MSISVFAVTDDLLSREPRVHECRLEGAEVRAIVEAIAALPDVDDVAWPVFLGDSQFGHCASSVKPDRLAAVVDAVGGETRAKLAPLMARALAERWLMTVEEGLDYPGYARVTLGTEKVDEACASWCSGNAVRAFRAVGYELDTSTGLDVPAATLVERCRGTLDPHVDQLGAIAAYALAVAGPHALVRAA